MVLCVSTSIYQVPLPHAPNPRLAEWPGRPPHPAPSRIEQRNGEEGRRRPSRAKLERESTSLGYTRGGRAYYVGAAVADQTQSSLLGNYRLLIGLGGIHTTTTTISKDRGE